jgi:hypothetical protein
MIRTFCTLCLMLCHICSFAQPSRDTFIRATNTPEFINAYMRISSAGRLISTTDTSCRGYYTAMANEDIRNGHPQLLVSHRTPQRSYADVEFEEKYHVAIQVFGQFLLDRAECFEAYNERTFVYLDSTADKKWHFDASFNSNSIMGFKQFNRKRAAK